jgi:hypothetical protein
MTSCNWLGDNSSVTKQVHEGLYGVPAHGNIRSGWDAGCRYDFANPEYR